MTKAERTRSFIIEKAAPIINRKGLAGTSITDIMEATKLAKGGIYGNFGSKEEICAEALDYLLKNIGGIMAARVAAKESAREQFFALMNYYLETLVTEGYYGCPMLNFGAEADDTDPVIRQHVSKGISWTENLFSKIVQKGIDSGEFDKDLDAKLFALKAFVMIEGGMWMSRVQKSDKKMKLIIGMLKKELDDHRI